MKISIRTKFTIGIVFFFIIILVISILSAFYLNNLSRKTKAILHENHYSVIYARDMSENLTKINQEIIYSFLMNIKPDTLFINKELKLFDKSLNLENENITETGEDKLVESIEANFNDYSEYILHFEQSPVDAEKVLFIQEKYISLYKQLVLLSQINETAIQLKTEDARISAKNALTQMTILGTLCFLIALSFTFSFASYFNERFFQLYNGIKEISSNNFGHRLHFEGKDEFQEISIVFNEMAEKLNDNEQKMALTLQTDLEKDRRFDNTQELKRILLKMKSIEAQAIELISKLENKI